MNQISTYYWSLNHTKIKVNGKRTICKFGTDWHEVLDGEDSKY